MGETAPSVIEARAVHKASNALKMTFTDGPGEPFATAEQGTGDSRAKKFGTLLGFNNGGTGKHRVKFADGSQLDVTSRDGKPSEFTRPDGSPVAVVERADTSIARGPDGTELARFVPHEGESSPGEVWRLDVVDPAGAIMAGLDIIRTVQGWTLWRVEDAIYQELVWWDRAGRALPIPIQGCRLIIHRPLSEVERLILVGASVDIVIGIRPYVAAMNSR